MLPDIPTSDLVLDFEKEWIQNDPHRKHFEALGGQFPKHGQQMRTGVLRMIWIMVGRFLPHSGYHGMLDYEGCFSSKWLRKNIRDKNYLAVVDPYFNRSANYSFEKKDAKRWTFKKATEATIIKVFRSDTPAIYTLKELPTCCRIVKPAKSTIRVSTHVPIDMSALDTKVDLLTRQIDSARTRKTRLTQDGFVEDLIKQRNRLLILRKTAISVTPKNHVPNLYRRSEFGRLCGVGTNLQYISKEDRYLLLRNKDFYDYDFALCHPTIFYTLATHLKIKCDTIQHYLEKRTSVVAEIKNHIGLNEEVIKKILTVLVYTENPKTPFGEIKDLCKSDERFSRLLNLHMFCALADEYRNGREAIVKRYTKGKITTSPTGHHISEGKSSRRLSLILQSIESEMLEYACQQFSNTVLLCFDGWISPKRNVVRLMDYVNKAISKKLGVNVELKIKETLIP